VNDATPGHPHAGSLAALGRAQNCPRRRAVAPRNSQRKAEDFVSARRDLPQVRPFQDHNPATQQRMVRRKILRTKSFHRQVVDSNEDSSGIGQVIGARPGEIGEARVELTAPKQRRIAGAEQHPCRALQVVRLQDAGVDLAHFIRDPDYHRVSHEPFQRDGINALGAIDEVACSIHMRTGVRTEQEPAHICVRTIRDTALRLDTHTGVAGINQHAAGYGKGDVIKSRHTDLSGKPRAGITPCTGGAVTGLWKTVQLRRQDEMNKTMKGAAVKPGKEKSTRTRDLPLPAPMGGECLVRVLEVGIDATDREIDAGDYGEGPPDTDYLILGHEVLGVIEQLPQQGAGDLRKGDLVVATVRRACPQLCANCDAEEYDFCSTGDYLERGIKGAHGYLAEFFTERPEFLVRVPEGLRTGGVLLEPMSILERSFRQIYEIQSRLVWRPRRVLITGAGNMGVVAALLARLQGLDALVYSRGEQEGGAGDILRETGAGYFNSDKGSIADAVEELGGAPDIGIEGTGHSPLSWELAESLATNGIACLLGVAKGDVHTRIPSDELNTKLVLGNRTVFGSVNAHRTDFERGVDDLLSIQSRWPEVLPRFITHEYTVDEIRTALDLDDPLELKTIITFEAG
jgi:glucose 1-dehydrogenase